MPVVSFETLPDAARVWVFGSEAPLTEDGTAALLRGVDEYLADWKAHGAPLTVAREWRDGRFLAVAVDQSTAGASGCSIDGLFRVLQQLAGAAGTSLVAGMLSHLGVYLGEISACGVDSVLPLTSGVRVSEAMDSVH